MIKDEESSSLTRRYYRCKQSETGVFWGGKGGRASTCDARDTGAKEGSGGRGDGRVFPPHPYSNVRSFFQSRVACTAAKETASSSLHCVPDLKPIARPPENLLLAGLDTEWVEYMVQMLLIHYWAFKIFICTNPI